MLFMVSIKEDVSIFWYNYNLRKNEKKVKKSLRLFWCPPSQSLCFPHIQGMHCSRMGNPLCTFCIQVSCIQNIPLRLSLCCKDNRVSWYNNNNIIGAVKGFLEHDLRDSQLEIFPGSFIIVKFVAQQDQSMGQKEEIIAKAECNSLSHLPYNYCRFRYG